MELISFSENSQVAIRKKIAQSLGHLCNYISNTFLEKKLLPILSRLTKDTEWTVRKSTTEVLLPLSRASPRPALLSFFTPILLRALNDPSRWVKLSAYETLGKFLYLLKPALDFPLLKTYREMTDSKSTLITTGDIAFYSAYSFSAVLSALGKDGWTFLKPAFMKLVANSQWKIRRTLAYSLHHVARILGDQIATTQLIPVLNAFLNDIPQVRAGVLANLHLFIHLIPPDSRHLYIMYISTQV
jgi:serine/threonine-protein phosphatase 4 regulatory subunit 1